MAEVKGVTYKVSIIDYPSGKNGENVLVKELNKLGKNGWIVKERLKTGPMSNNRTVDTYLLYK